jgi:hypothetical protein
MGAYRQVNSVLAIVNSITPRRAAPSPIRTLRNTEELADRAAPLIAIALVSLFALWAWIASGATRLQFDELLELSAATASTAAGVVSTLAAGVDYNPPLSHFLVRAFHGWFGDAEWALRFPAFLGFEVLLVSLYFFVGKQLGRMYGVIAMLVIVCLPVREYAIQVRPYGMVLGFSGLCVLLFGTALHQGRRLFSLAGLALCTGALTASHYYGVLVVGVLSAAALVRSWELRKTDWPLLVSCAAPPLLVLVLLRNVIAQQKHELAHYFARGNLLSFDHGYDDFAMDPLVYCVALVLGIVLLFLCARAGELRMSGQPFRDIQPGLMALSLGLLALPLAGAVITQVVTHAYLTRYFLPASLGLAICACCVLRSVAGAVPGLALVAVLSLSIGFGKAILQQTHHSPDALPAASVLQSEATPILFDTPEAYLQVYHYVPSVRRNIWVIADPVAALHYRKYDTDDHIMLALARQGKAQAVSLAAAVRMWPAFRLVPRSADYVWALKCVMDAGAQIAVRQPFGASNFIFEVNVRPESIPAIEACGQQ